MQKRIKEILKQVDLLLNVYGDSNALIRKAISGNEDNLWKFLTSNELWGGSGSIADQGIYGSRSEDRKFLESLLIDLGEIQIKVGKVNQRTEMWVSAFKEWKGKGI